MGAPEDLGELPARFSWGASGRAAHPGPAVCAGLGAIYSQIEDARQLAQVGKYAAAKRGLEAVLAHIHRAIKSMEDPVLKARWQECVRAISEEVQLVAACEDECTALRLGAGDRVSGSRRRRFGAQRSGAAAPSQHA